MNEQKKTEPEQENELLQSVKDKLAIDEYSCFWYELHDSHRAHLVDKVAIRYAELVNNQKQ